MSLAYSSKPGVHRYPFQVEKHQYRGPPRQAYGSVLWHQYLDDHDPVAQVPNLADTGVGPHRADQPEVAPEDGHAAVPVQADQGIAGEFDPLKVRELARPLAAASRRTDEIAAGRELPDLVRAAVRHDEAAIRQPPHIPHRTEVMSIARARFRPVEQRLHTDPPACRVAPGGRERTR